MSALGFDRIALPLPEGLNTCMHVTVSAQLTLLSKLHTYTAMEMLKRPLLMVTTS